MNFDKIYLVSLFTFKEIIKSKILISVFISGLALMLMTYVATEFTYGVPERVALDFGLGMLSLSSLGISVFLGVNLLSKEIDSRTIYMVISRPVARYEFILGKIIGLLGIQFINMVILSGMILTSVNFLGGEIAGLTYWAIGFIFIESVLLLLLVIFLSLIVNNTLSVIISVVILILGHAVKDAQNLSFVKQGQMIKTILDVYHFILPGFYKLNLKDFITYQNNLSSNYLLLSSAYGFLYSGFLLILIIFIFNKKNID